MSDPADAARWTPGSPAWVTHHAMQAENCQLRNDRDRLRAELAALAQALRIDAEDARTRGYLEAWNAYVMAAEGLATLLTEAP